LPSRVDLVGGEATFPLPTPTAGEIVYAANPYPLVWRHFDDAHVRVEREGRTISG